MLLNLLLLGLCVLPTQLMSAHVTVGGCDAHTATFACSLVMGYVVILFSATWWCVTRQRGKDLQTAMTPGAVRSIRGRFSIGAVIVRS